MPNIITHKILGEEVIKKIKRPELLNMLQKHEALFYIGTNGPDFLFFHHVKPWEKWKSQKLNQLGSQAHAMYVNAFYQEALTCILEQKDNRIKEAMTVYLCGHLCHWALDQTTHPFIFYYTGDCKGYSASLHHRFESMLDTLMLKKYHDTTIKDYDSSKICEFDEEMLKAISRIYVPVAKRVFDTTILVNEIRESLLEWKQVQKLLYDPNNKKFTFLQKAEKVIKKPWFISGNVVKAEPDESFDILNEEHREWCHPCDDKIKSTASFQELFDEAIELALQAIEVCLACVLKQKDTQALCDILQDRAYDSGMPYGNEMKYFSIIYEEGQENHETV